MNTLSFDFLLNTLNEFQIDYVHIYDKDIPIMTIRFLNNIHKSLDSHILYIGYASKIVNLKLPTDTLNIICIEDIPLEKTRYQMTNIIIVNRDACIQDIFNHLQSILWKEREYNSWAGKLITHLADNLQEIVDLGYDMLGNPIMIYDLYDHTVNAAGRKEIIDDPAWSKDDKNIPFNLSNKGNSPFYRHDPYSKQRSIICKVMVNHQQVGYLSVFEDEKPFGNDDLRLVSLLCSAVSVVLKRNTAIYSVDGEFTCFIQDLITGKVTDTSVIDDKIKMLKLPHNVDFYSVVIDVDTHHDRSIENLFRWSKSIESMVKNCKTIIYDGCIFLLLYYDKSKNAIAKDLNGLKEFLAEKNLKAGVSRCFYDLSDLQEHYSQSLYALKMGKRLDDGISNYLYEDYAIFRLVKACLKTDDYMNYCHPSVLNLIEYDKLYNTNLASTLARFVFHTRNIAATAADLNIHRNTVLYRIARIRQIIDTDLDDSNILLQLQFSFKIMEYLKMKEKSK